MKTVSSFGFLAVAAGAHALTPIYSNVTTFTGFGYVGGGATVASPITNLVADDIAFAPGMAGKTVDAFTFSVANFDSSAFSARARVRFYDVDTTTGGPGTFLTGFTFNPITFSASSVNLFTFASSAMFTVPSGNAIWAGITFDNVGATATVANLNNLGQGIFNPPTIGSSDDVFFQTGAAGSFASNNPAGGFLYFGGSPVANFGWSFSTAQPVPEPASLAVLGVGAAAMLRRRRK